MDRRDLQDQPKDEIARGRDPLGLRRLPLVEAPTEDGWADLRARLTARDEDHPDAPTAPDPRTSRAQTAAAPPWRRPVGWAMAASVLLAVVALTLNERRAAPAPERRADAGQAAGALTGQDPSPVPGAPSTTEKLARVPNGEDPSVPLSMGNLVDLSQQLERRIRDLRGSAGPLTGAEAIWVAEIEDTIARVDGALIGRPDSLDLWGQRVNLLLDLQAIYLHHWETEYRWLATR